MRVFHVITSKVKGCGWAVSRSSVLSREKMSELSNKSRFFAKIHIIIIKKTKKKEEWDLLFFRIDTRLVLHAGVECWLHGVVQSNTNKISL